MKYLLNKKTETVYFVDNFIDKILYIFYLFKK